MKEQGLTVGATAPKDWVVAAPARVAQGFSPDQGLWISPRQLQGDDSVVALPFSVPGPSIVGEIGKAADPVQGMWRNHEGHSDPYQTDAQSAAGVKQGGAVPGEVNR